MDKTDNRCVKRIKMIQPYGGILINRKIEDHAEVNKSLKRIEVTRDVLLEIENIAHGVYSPLTGFPSLEDIDSILDTWKLKNGLVFPIPPLFHLTKKDYNRINPEEDVILVYKKKPIGIMNIKEKGELDKQKYIEKIFRTTDPEHLGVAYINKINEYIITGSIKTFNKLSYFFNEDALTPEETRRKIEIRRWKNTVAFSTTNIPHRAHEYLQRIALELFDGLFIHALLQFGKDQKFSREQIKKSYSTLIEKYYPKKRILFSFLPILPRSAGPRSSLLQAIIRQNYGCSHQIFGRDHEGFKNIFGKYESQEIFDKFSDIKLQPLKLRGPYYCKKCELIVTDKNCNHSEKHQEEISGTRVRSAIQNKKKLPEYIIRRDILTSL